MTELYKPSAAGEHPITPPPELRKLWAQQAQRMDPHDPVAWQEHVATQAAQWGADMELKACCSEMDGWGDIQYSSGYKFSKKLRWYRRPKPPNLKEQALSLVPEPGGIPMNRFYSPDELLTIRKALEALND